MHLVASQKSGPLANAVATSRALCILSTQGRCKHLPHHHRSKVPTPSDTGLSVIFKTQKKIGVCVADKRELEACWAALGKY